MCYLQSYYAGQRLHYSKMPPTTGDLIRLTDHEASVQHNQAVSRDYISQPRLGNEG